MHDRRPSRLHALTRRLSGVDPLVPVVGVVALVTYALHGINGMLTRDLAVYSYAGQRVAEGVPPYEGVLNRAGPLAHALPAIGVWIARLGGFDDLTTMRLLFMGFAIATVCVMYLLGRDLFGSRRVGLLTAAAFLSFAGFIQYAADGPREKTPMTLFIAISMWAVTRRRWFVAGMFVGLATLCLQTAFFSSVTVLLVGALVFADGPRWRALVRAGAGGAVTALATVVYFVTVDALTEAVDGFYLINARYTTPDSPMTHLDTTWEALREAYGVSLWVLVAGLVGLAVLAAASLSKRVREAYPWSPLMVAFLAGALAGIRWDMHEYDAWPDLFPLLPLGAVGVGALVKVLMGRLPLRAGVAVTLVAALAATGLAFSEARDNRNDLLEVQRQSVDAVLGRLPSDATIISLEAPQPLVLARKTNPERHQMFGSGLTGYIADTWPGGMDGFRDWVVDHSPTVIVEGDPMPEIWRKAIEPDYVYVGCAPDFFWYVQRSLGERKIEELREAARIEYSGAYGMRDGPCPPPG